MYLHTIRGWFSDTPSSPGPGGIRIPESGLAARISRLGSVSASDGGAVLDGGGATGGSIGIITTRFTITPGITPRAGRFITATPTTTAEVGTAEFTTILALRRDPLTETTRRPGDMPRPTVRVASVRAHSAAMTTVGRLGVSHRGEAAASTVEAEADFMVVAED